MILRFMRREASDEPVWLLTNIKRKEAYERMVLGSLDFNVLALSWNRTRYAVRSCHGLHCNWVMQLLALNLVMCQACRAAE